MFRRANSTYAIVVAILVLIGAGAGLLIELSVQKPSSQITNSISSPDADEAKDAATTEDYRYNIAYVKPVFTETAYHDNGFYDFYVEYMETKEEVTQNLDWLKPVIYEAPLDDKLVMFFDHLRSQNNNTDVTVISDIDLDLYDGNLLLEDNKGKKYDAVILGHQEYVTQKEYEVLKEYVAKSGTLIVLNGNVFYAEVDYDKNSNTVQLVKGHNWEFDGSVAKKSVAERWADETSLWIGSNYLCSECEITFGNNPFKYKHAEEQYVTNPEVDIILNYKAHLKDIPGSEITIATYKLAHGDGQVIVMGIYAEHVIEHQKFRDFFDYLLQEYVFE